MDVMGRMILMCMVSTMVCGALLYHGCSWGIDS